MTSLECKAILNLVPDAKFENINNGEFIWLDSRPQPSKTLINKEVASIKQKMELDSKKRKIPEYIYAFYSSEKQQQDNINFTAYKNKLSFYYESSEINSILLNIVEIYKKANSGTTIASIVRSLNLENKDIPTEELNKIFEKLSKVFIRTQWIQENISIGTEAISKDITFNFTPFPNL